MVAEEGCLFELVEGLLQAQELGWIQFPVLQHREEGTEVGLTGG